MIVGHFAVALGAKRYAPGVSLGILFLACQLADFLMPVLFLIGIEQLEIEVGATVMMPLNLPDYPFCQSLVALWLIFAWGFWIDRNRQAAMSQD